MALFIDEDLCTFCGYCLDVCPTNSIREAKAITINAATCNECEDYDNEYQCQSVCPVSGCIEKLA